MSEKVIYFVEIRAIRSELRATCNFTWDYNNVKFLCDTLVSQNIT